MFDLQQRNSARMRRFQAKAVSVVSDIGATAAATEAIHPVGRLNTSVEHDYEEDFARRPISSDVTR
jgi:hypothetical protein